MLNRNNKIRTYHENSAADSLRELLEFHKVTQADFAKHIGVTQAYVSDILNRKKFMSTDVAIAIEKATGLRAEWLIRLDLSYQLANRKEELDKIKKLDKVEQFDWARA